MAFAVKRGIIVITVILIIIASIIGYFTGATTTPPTKTITHTVTIPYTTTVTVTPTPFTKLKHSLRIAILYDPAEPVLNAQGEAAIVAIEEINAAGGILGQPIVYRTWNTMRRVDAALAAYREAVVDWSADVVIIEGVSEEALALMEEGAWLYSQYPHILVVAGSMSADITLKVMNGYDKYKFVFRMFHADFDGNVLWPASILWEAKNVFGINKIALLIEGAAWTFGARNSIVIKTEHGVIEQKSLRDLTKEAGLEIVYEATIPVGEKIFIPYLEAAYVRGAELILVISSWYTDTIALTKQWATSAARDIYLVLYGGSNHWLTFWNLTGGAALGVITPLFDVEDFPPISPLTQSFIRKMHEKGLRVDMSAHYYYSAIYHIKEAVEWLASQGIDPLNIDELIRALETIHCTTHTLLPQQMCTLGSKEKGRFHSYPAITFFMYQFQRKDKIVMVGWAYRNPYFRECYPEDWIVKHLGTNPSPPKKPADLRKELGVS